MCFEKRQVSFLTQIMEEQNPLGTERIGKLIPKFAIPSIISMVVSSLYNIAFPVTIICTATAIRPWNRKCFEL